MVSTIHGKQPLTAAAAATTTTDSSSSSIGSTQDAASTRSDFRKAPADVNRIPGSAASMHVQERRKDTASTTTSSASTASASASTSSSSDRATTSAVRSRNAIQAMQPFLDSSSSSAIQPTDIQLLTKSILSNQERQRVILHYQEHLIDAQPSLPELKKSLVFLSNSSWGQILEERKLAGKCAYPPCPHASPETAKLEGRYRISLRSQKVKAVDEVDLGEAGNTWDDLKSFFCSKACYARSEWILRWVLGDQEAVFDERGDAQGSNAKGAGGSGGGGVLGGKWQKMLQQHEARYEDVELLEDIERANGACFAEQPEAMLHRTAHEPDEEVEENATAVNAVVVDGAERTNAATQVSNLLGDLTIVERAKDSQTAGFAGAGSTSASAAAATVSPSRSSLQQTRSAPSRTAYDVDVPNSLGRRFHNSATAAVPNLQHADDNHDNDDDDDADMYPHERQLSSILRYASLATGSRPPARTRTTASIRLSAAPPSQTGSTVDAAEDGGGSDAEPDAPTIDAHEAAERAQLRRMMDLALDVRRDQRELGLLD